MKQLMTIMILLCCLRGTAQTAIAGADPRKVQMGAKTMKQYYFVMLTKGKGKDRVTDIASINKLQEGHMANIERLHREGKLMLAGPFGDDGNWRGIFVLDCETSKEAEQLLATDPMIKAGCLDYELRPWWTEMNSVFK